MSLVGLALAVSAMPLQVRLTPQIVISRSRTVAKGTYRIPTGEDLKTPAIRIQGNDITVDFKGAILEGTPQTTEPDQRKGLGVLVQGKNVTIKHLVVRGYKVGLMARDCPGLKILDSDFSYNWKQHLASTLDKEDESDWQSYHHNDHDEWLYGRPNEGVPGYAGAIYLHGCKNFEVKGCKAVGGQCGLMLTQCDHGLVWNSDFSFLSGIGLAMYRSSDNRIMNNKIDWCVRGFSLGVYNRGQDSAGILIYEQSNRNVFAYNSVTHGGDGFFLWAGQTTMDTGEGGCNDNLLYGNDFSHAPTNGIEATFSRNDFVNNLVLECWHGVWGGYGYDSKVLGNVFGHNDEAIAWEHGQDNVVKYNQFYDDNVGIHLWGGPVDPKFVYAQKRDASSKNWTIGYNDFVDEFTAALQAERTDGISFIHNRLQKNGRDIRADDKVTGLVQEANRSGGGVPKPLTTSLHPGFTTLKEYLDRFGSMWNQPAPASPAPPHIPDGPYAGYDEIKSYAPKPLAGAQKAFLPQGALRGWRYILVDEWGPYDFKRPILWPRGSEPSASGGETKYRFEIIGPPGTWRVVGKQGVESVVPDHGKVEPGTEIEVTFPRGRASNVKLTLEYKGAATTDYRGIVTPAGKPVRFGYSKFFAPIDWNVRFYKWSKSSDPADVHATPDEAAFQEAIKGQPLKTLHNDRLDFAGSAFDPVTGNDHFATVADGTFTIQPGDYVLEMTSDDGARLWLDGKPLIEDAWHYQGPTLYSRTVHLGVGEHKLHVEHFQIDGYAALKVSLKPKK
ncbi:MAG TPA: right-handed parallel beta-helix repeat-containing protein [Fimbriimonadaceae bacterium]|nr:right-handed parallel beta-helix repeat-containing protein [Fimbriimonadaceae bacterium]